MICRECFSRKIGAVFLVIIADDPLKCIPAMLVLTLCIFILSVRKNPGNIELEMLVEKDLPTVFFAQTFCAKNQLAKYLANEYNGLYIDIDGTPTNSIKAKIEAFLRLR